MRVNIARTPLVMSNRNQAVIVVPGPDLYCEGYGGHSYPRRGSGGGPLCTTGPLAHLPPFFWHEKPATGIPAFRRLPWYDAETVSNPWSAFGPAVRQGLPAFPPVGRCVT